MDKQHKNSSHHHEHAMVESVSSVAEYIKFSGVILAIILTAWSLGSFTGADSATEWMRLFMGVFFLVFASFKLVGFRMFTMMFASYDLVARRFKPYSYAYPFVEALLGLAYLVDFMPLVRDPFTLVIMTVSSVGVGQEIYRRKSGVYCACLGNVIRLPLSTVSLVENVAMGVMAASMVAAQL